MNGARCAASRPQRIAAVRDPALRSGARSSSSSRKRRRTGSRSARSSTCEAVRRAVGELEQLGRRRRAPGWSGAASGRRAGRAGRPGAARPAPARLVLVVGGVSPAPNVGLDQRRERLDVRAHDDHVARLERRVLREHVQDRVAQHLDLAGAAVAGVDLDAAVVGVERRAPVSVARQRRARRRAIGADVGLRRREQRAGRRRDRDGGGRRRRPAPSTSCSSRDVPAPRGQQPVGGQRRGRVVGAAADRRRRRSSRARRPRPTAPARGAAGTGGRRAGAAERRAARCELRGRQPRQAEQRQPSRQLEQRRRPRGAARRPCSSRSAGLGTPIRVAQPPPQLGLPAAPTRGSPQRPSARIISGRWQRVAVEQVGEVAHGAEPPGLTDRVRRGALSAEVGGERAPATARRGTRRRPRAAATPPLGQPRIAVGVDRRTPSAPRRRRAVRGDGNSTFAHTPSPRPGLAPRCVDSRWVSQRSIPRVGTATTSGAKGSSSGSARTARRAKTRPSARSER